MVSTPIIAVNFMIVIGLLIIYLLMRKEGSRVKEILPKEKQLQLIKINHKYLALVTINVFFLITIIGINFWTSALTAGLAAEIYAYLALKSRINIIVVEHCGE